VEHLKNKRKAELEKATKKSKKSKKDKEIQVDFENYKLRSDILRFREDRFIIVKTNDIESIVPELSVSEGTGMMRSWKNNPLKVFLLINSIKIFEILSRVINDEFVRLTSLNEVAESSKKYYRRASVVEVIKFVGVYILVENMWGNETKECLKNFITLKKKEMFEMGQQRFFAMRNSVAPENEMFAEMVSEWLTNSQKHWIPGPQISIDESIFASQATSKWFVCLGSSNKINCHE